MKMKYPTILSVGLLWMISLGALTAWAADAPHAGPPDLAPQAAIKQARLKQNQAIARHDVEKIASYWTEDVTICRGLGLQLSGKSAYRKLFEEDDPTSPDVIVYQRLPTSIVTSGVWPLAFETGVWNGHLGKATGPVVIRGRYSAQWVNRSGRWLIRSEVFVALSGAGAGLRMKAAP